MADIRVERKSGGVGVWLWVLLAVVLLIAAALLLDRAGYIDLPINVGSGDMIPSAPAQLANGAGVHLQEA